MSLAYLAKDFETFKQYRLRSRFALFTSTIDNHLKLRHSYALARMVSVSTGFNNAQSRLVIKRVVASSSGVVERIEFVKGHRMTRTNLNLHRQVQSLTDTFEFLDTAHGLESAIEFITHPCENQKVQLSQWPDDVRTAALEWLKKQYEAFENQPIYLFKTQAVTKFNKHTDFIITTRKEWALKHDIVDLDRAFLNLPDGFIATANPEEAKLIAIRLRKKKIIKKRVRNDLIKKIDHHSVQLPAERLLQAMALTFPNKCLLDKIEIFEDRTVENNAFFNEWPIHVQQRAQAILKDRYESFLSTKLSMCLMRRAIWSFRRNLKARTICTFSSASALVANACMI